MPKNIKIELDNIEKGTVPVEMLSKMPKGATVSTKEGWDDLLQCGFDMECVFRNLDYIINNALNSVFLNCYLGTPITPPGEPTRRVSSGACYSWWGLPVIGQPQKCENFDSATKSTNLCKQKCQENGWQFEAAGCDGMTLWCWCQVP